MVAVRRYDCVVELAIAPDPGAPATLATMEPSIPAEPSAPEGQANS